MKLVSMPKAARITSVKNSANKVEVSIFLRFEANATLYYGVVGKDVKFNEKILSKRNVPVC